MRRRFHISHSLGRVVLVIAGLLLLLAPATMFGQGCALCYTQAAASTQRFIAALRSGILILMVPPFLMSIAFTVMVYRRRNSYRTDAGPSN